MCKTRIYNVVRNMVGNGCGERQAVEHAEDMRTGSRHGQFYGASGECHV